MIQLRLSLPHEKAEYFDQLQSYRRYRARCLKGTPGATVAALYALQKAIAFIPDYNSVIGTDIVHGYNEVIPANQKRITPGSGTWQAFLGGEFSSALGKLLSCPSTNITVFNIEARRVRDIGFEELYKEIISQLSRWENRLDTYVSPSEVITLVRESLFTQSGGLLVDTLTFEETNVLSWKIEKEIFDQLIIRDGSVNSSLAKGGAIPDSPISPALVKQHLSHTQQLQYISAQRQGLVGVLKTLNANIAERSKGNSDNSQKGNITSVNYPTQKRRGKPIMFYTLVTRDQPDGSRGACPDLRGLLPANLYPAPK